MEEKKPFQLKTFWQERNVPGTVAARLWELFKFCVAGGFGFVLEFALFHLFANVLNIQYLIANAISFVISVVINYLLCSYWVFSGANKQSKAAMLAFLVTSLIGLGLNELFMLLFVGALGMQSDLQKMIAKAITAVLVLIWNYFSKRKVLTYKKKGSGDAVSPDPMESTDSNNLPS